MKRFLTVLAVLVWSTPIAAQTSGADQSILIAWDAWAEQYKIARTSISVGFNGKIIAREGRGRDPDAPYPVASLSKAITAVCLADVLQERGLAFDTRLGEAQDIFDRVGLTIPARLRDVTLGQLVTMQGGLKPDVTQGHFNPSRNYGETRNVAFSLMALEEQGLQGEPGRYFYNNGSYAILGAFLEALTGEDNVTVCKPRVFPEGAGHSAGFDPAWMALGAFGGWSVSSSDYLAFVMAAFRPRGQIAENFASLPGYRDPQGWGYGLGTLFRVRSPQNVYWHFGALCGTRGGDQGSYFAYYENGYAVSVNYDACSREPLGAALDTALWAAAHPG